MTDHVEGFAPEQIESGRRLFVSPITSEPYLVTSWVDKGDGRFVAIEKRPIGDEDRLFVPLNTDPYRWFECRQKDVELRGVRGAFNAKTVYSGRPVELRRGYSTPDSLWGIIHAVWFFGSIESVADELDHSRIIPDVSRREFVDEAAETVGDDYDRYVAFEVRFD